MVEPEFAAAALLHDVSEAVIGDISTPLGEYIDEVAEAASRTRAEMAGVKPLDAPIRPLHCFKRALECWFAADFGVVPPWTAQVKAADTLALHIERRLFMAPAVGDAGEWPPVLVNIDLAIAGMRPEFNLAMDMEGARSRFLQRAKELGVTHGRTIAAPVVAEAATGPIVAPTPVA